MMTKTFECIECGASAPYGRLSCPSCGALLASVTGGRGSAVRVARVGSEPQPEMPSEAVDAASVAVATADQVKPATTRKRTPPPFLDRPEPQAPVAVAPVAATAVAATAPAPSTVAPKPAPTTVATAPAPKPAATTAAAAPAPKPAPTTAAATKPAATTAAAATSAKPPPTTAAPKPAAVSAPAEAPAPAPAASRTPSYAPTPAVAARARVEADRARAEAERAAIVPLLEPSAIAALPSTPWAPIVEPPPVLVGRPYQRHLAPEIDQADDRMTPPSAYRPPSQAMALAMGTAVAPSNGVHHAYPSTGSEAPASEARASEAPTATTSKAKDLTWWLDTVPDPARFVEIAGWFIVVGATMSLLGFLLPWSRVVIGASTVGGYFDGWGLASPSHLFVFTGLLAVLALAIRGKPVPAWISSGILGLVFGGLLLGLAWPYVVGPLGADVGLTMTVLGGVALLIGGVVALWATRHVAAEPLV